MESTAQAQNGNQSKQKERPAPRTPVVRKASCPVCASTVRIDKVSSVVRRGRGRLVWENGEVAHYETDLAERLSAPPSPKGPSIRKALVGITTHLLMLAAVLGLLTVLGKQDYLYISTGVIDMARRVAVVWFALLKPSVIVLRFVQARREQKRQLPLWMVARRKWSGLYYCPSDDIVFAPNLGAAPPNEMLSLLYPVSTVAEEPIHHLPGRAVTNVDGLQAAD